MNELKASPGPWEYVAKLSPSENHRGFFIRAEKATRNGKWALAEVQPGDEDGKLGKANAALIAAAPELYAALEQMHSMWSAHCRANGWEPDHVAESANAIAALQKARGE
jgi:hypothetical protein